LLLKQPNRPNKTAAVIKVTYEDQKPAVGFEANFATAYQPGSGLGWCKNPGKKKAMRMRRCNLRLFTTNEIYTTPFIATMPWSRMLTIAEWNGNKLTVYDATQIGYGRTEFAVNHIGCPERKHTSICLVHRRWFLVQRVLHGPILLLAPMAAKQFNRPVKIELKRQQVFSYSGRRTQTHQKIGLGAGQDGKLTAIKHDTISETSFVTNLWKQQALPPA